MIKSIPMILSFIIKCLTQKIKEKIRTNKNVNQKVETKNKVKKNKKEKNSWRKYTEAIERKR
jgi:hypothetical protein